MKRNEFEAAVYDPANQLNGTDVAVLLWYANHIYWKKADSLAWGSAQNIAKAVRKGTRSVEGSRPRLVELGWLVDSGERVHTKNGRPLVKYSLAIPTFPAPIADNLSTFPAATAENLDTTETTFPATSAVNPTTNDDTEEVSRSFEEVSRNSDRGFPQFWRGFPATSADEYVKNMLDEDVIEDGTQGTVPDGPVRDNLPNVREVKEEPRGKLFLSPLEKKEVQKKCLAFSLNDEDAEEMMDWIGSKTIEGDNFDERLTAALTKKGVDTTNEW